MSSKIVGIDLGTTNSAIGLVDSGFPILLANEAGKRIMPSAIYVGQDGSVEVGEAALRRRALEPERVLLSLKRLMGLRGQKALQFANHNAASLRDDGQVVLFGKTPIEWSAVLLSELKRVAEWRLEESIQQVVITVPAYFNDLQRGDTLQACELAGLQVARMINEPTAAALSYQLDTLADRSRVAVYDLGGGTFDLSIMELHQDVFQVLATHGDTHLGGDDLDEYILQWVMKTASVTELSRAALLRWKQESQRVKCLLSEQEEARFCVPFFDGNQSIEVLITRHQLNQIADSWVSKTLQHCKQALMDVNLKVADVDAVVMVGGSTRLAIVQELVSEFFGRKVDVSQHPDEAIALGAAIQAGVLSGAMRKTLLLDVTPLSLGIETLGGLMNVIIPRNTSIPCKAGEMFTNAADQQQKMVLRVLQGEREMAKDNWELGCYEVPFSPDFKGKARVGVEFSIDENGILQVLARDMATGQDQIMQVQRAAIDVSDAQVEAMVSESVEHAFEDMAQRIFTEAKLKAEELLPAVEMALAQNIATEEERALIQQASQRVQDALLKQSHYDLKAAVQELDHATEALAARMLEQAMNDVYETKL